MKTNRASASIRSPTLVFGEKSPEEKSMAPKGMFKKLREKFNEAAEIEGFDKVGEKKQDMELYCKSNKDGTQIGDCPYAQFVQLVLLKKGLTYDTIPTPVKLIPEAVGQLPALVHKGRVITEVLSIAEYLEQAFPYSSLTRQGAYSYQEVIEKFSGFFPAISNFIRNKEVAKDDKLQAVVDEMLDSIDRIILSTPGAYICGNDLTLADLYLLPQLFHAMVAMKHFKEGLTVLHEGGSQPTRLALEKYMTRMLEMEEFNDKRAYYSANQVIYGWKVLRGEI